MQASVSDQSTPVAYMLAQPTGMSALTFIHVVSANLWHALGLWQASKPASQLATALLTQLSKPCMHW